MNNTPLSEIFITKNDHIIGFPLSVSVQSISGNKIEDGSVAVWYEKLRDVTVAIISLTIKMDEFLSRIDDTSIMELEAVVIADDIYQIHRSTIDVNSTTEYSNDNTMIVRYSADIKTQRNLIDYADIQIIQSLPSTKLSAPLVNVLDALGKSSPTIIITLLYLFAKKDELSILV